MMELRPYQAEMIEEARKAVEAGKKNVLMYAPTGAGKTITIARMMYNSARNGVRSIFLAHRRELVKQTAARFEQYGISTTILMAGYEFDPSADLVVASQPTWESRHDWLDKEYGVVIFDEAHVGVSRQKRIIDDIRESTPNAIVIGVTATPMTNSGPGLGSIYDHLVHGPTISELTEMGYLVPAEHYIMQPLDFDPSKHIKVNSVGEYDEGAVYDWLKANKVVGDIVDNWTENLHGLPTIVFARSVRQSIWIAEEFGNAGIPAAHIDYRTPDKVRREILEKYESGEILVLTNVDVFSEGFDAPHTRAILLATPMRSVPRYVQRVGRGLRIAPGKEKVTIVDHGGVLQEHGTIYNYQRWALEPPEPSRFIAAHAVKVRTETERECPMCGHTFRAGLRECPQCGYDFNYLPPGIEPPIIPATMVSYEEGMKQVAKGTRLKCRGSRLPYGYTYETAYRELLGLVKSQGKKPGWTNHIFYHVFCTCPDEHGVFPWSEPLEPTDNARRWQRKYFILKKQGVISKRRYPCGQGQKPLLR